MFPNAINTVLYLISIVNKSDALGVRKPTIVKKKKALGTLKSITVSEYQAGIAINKLSEIKITLQNLVYSEEKFVLLKDKIYKVDRTFMNGQFIELYLSGSEYTLEDLTDVTIDR